MAFTGLTVLPATAEPVAELVVDVGALRPRRSLSRPPPTSPNIRPAPMRAATAPPRSPRRRR
ncbi:hypothetical protein I552_8317 [Mycobacterium xenopi 3993]|nr:hypothetical protein I552_8317 [Mycobacterium xenopi 3993]